MRQLRLILKKAGVLAAAVASLGFCLADSVLAQSNQSDFQVMKSRNLAFDLDVAADQKAAIHSIELYVSRDNSGVWELGATATPDAKSIPYTAKDDGLYLINMVIVYKDRTRDPVDVTRVAPLQKLLVDATSPGLRITTAERKDGEIRLAWSVDERNPADAKTRVEKKVIGESELGWKPITLVGSDRRAVRFPAEPSEGLTVRVTVEDLAGNTTTQTKDIPATSTSGFSPSGEVPPPNMKSFTQPDNMILPTMAPATIPPPASAPVVDLTKSGSTALAPPMLNPPAMPLAPNLSTPGTSTAPVPPPAPLPASTPIASGSGLGQTSEAATTPVEASVKIINFLKFDVPYQLEAGPSGLSKIELYVTRDDGRTWARWSVHEGDQKPLRVALDTRSNVKPEGTYGFRLVPISGAGISEHPPTEGSSPDFRVLVDLSPPLIRVYAPEADPARPGVLVLKWEIKDKNPARDSVAIAWSETATGPWNAIGADASNLIVAGQGSQAEVRLPDTGSYAWKLPEKIAPKVYLKMLAWDAAGNKSEVTTPNPVLVDLTKPRARIQDIVPVGIVRSEPR